MCLPSIRHQFSLLNCLAILLFGVLSSVLLAGSAVGQIQNSTAVRRLEQFRERRSEILLNLRHELSQLSQQCFDNGLKQAAEDVTAIQLDLTSPTEGTSLPTLVQLPVSNRLPREEQLWRNRLTTIRSEKAKELYSLARQTLRADLPSLAYQLIHDVLRLDPDHKDARAVLGLQLFNDPRNADDPNYAGEWVSLFEADKRSGSKPEVNHPVYGWIPAANVDRYAEGVRPWRGKWVSEQKEAELRRDFANAWEIRTEHFLIKTNTSLEEGVVISRKLELFHDWLHSNFAAFFDTPAALEERFANTTARRRGVLPKPMEVHYYSTRDEYERRLKGKVPPNVTNGLYWEPDRTCYLFRNDDDVDLNAAFHETTHQMLDLPTIDDRNAAARKRQLLLRERDRRRWELCENSNFWVLEGLACYMESFRMDEGVVSIGDPSHIRFVGAKQRLLDDGFYVDLRSLSTLGMDAFQSHPNVRQLYTQGSGVAHFLLHYQDGIYRDALIKLLAGVYRPDLKDVRTEPSLEKITGVPFEVLDQQYREHMGNL
ncbi:MAG: hypothetical protein WAO83_12740 [Fuerstiella sp.]